MFIDGVNYSAEELAIAQSIISIVGEEVSIDEALEIYEEMSIAF